MTPIGVGPGARLQQLVLEGNCVERCDRCRFARFPINLETSCERGRVLSEDPAAKNAGRYLKVGASLTGKGTNQRSLHRI